MKESRLRSNPNGILSAMLAQKLSATEAAKRAGVNRDLMSRVLKSATPIRYETAARLRDAFGDDAIKIITAAQA